LQFSLAATRTIMSDGKTPNADLTEITTGRIVKIWTFVPSLGGTVIRPDFTGEFDDRFRLLSLVIPREIQLTEGAVFVDGGAEFPGLSAILREHPKPDDEYSTTIRGWRDDQTRLEVISRDGRVVRLRLTARLAGTGGGSTIPQESADGFLHLEGEIAIDFANQETIDLLGD